MTVPSDFTVTVQVFADIRFFNGVPVGVNVQGDFDRDYFVSVTDGAHQLSENGYTDMHGNDAGSVDDGDPLSEAWDLFVETDPETVAKLPWRVEGERLSVGDAVHLGAILAACGGQQVARSIDGYTFSGEARCVGDDRGNLLGREDVRDAYLRVTGGGFDYFWPVADLIAEMYTGHFVVNYQPNG